MEILPIEILTDLFSFLNPTDLYSVAQTCHLNNAIVFNIVLRTNFINISNKDKRRIYPYLKSLTQMKPWQLLTKAIGYKKRKLVAVLVKHSYISFKTVIKAIKSEDVNIARLVATKFIQRAMYFYQGSYHWQLGVELLYIDKLLRNMGIIIDNGKIQQLKNSSYVQWHAEHPFIRYLLEENIKFATPDQWQHLDLLTYNKFIHLKSLHQQRFPNNWMKNLSNQILFFPEPEIVFELIKLFPNVKLNPYLQQLIFTSNLPFSILNSSIFS